MRNIDLSDVVLIRDPEHRAFLGKVSGYTFFLYCLLPLIAATFLPYWLSLTERPFASLPTRLVVLAATGGVSFLIALAPAFLLMRTRVLRRIYVFLLLPVSMISLATQSIMYREFGTEIDARVLGLFQGNFSALWTFGCSEYHVDWTLALVLAASAALTFRICGKKPKRLIPPTKACAAIAVLLIASGSLALGLCPDIKRADHYHPTKLSTAPLYQVVLFP